MMRNVNGGRRLVANIQKLSPANAKYITGVTFRTVIRQGIRYRAYILSRNINLQCTLIHSPGHIAKQ